MAQTPFKARLGLETPTGQDVNSGGDIKINGVSINTGGTLDNVFYLDTQDMDDIADGTTYVKTENNLTDTLKANYDSAYTHSTTTTGNPHSVTKTDVGLGNVVNVDTTNADNISDGTTNAIITLTQETNFETAYSKAHDQNTDTGTSSDDFSIGNGTDTDKTITANNGDTNAPQLKYNASTNTWQYSNDGTTFNDIGSGSGGSTEVVYLEVTQATHGFDNDFVYNNGTTWVKAQADSETTTATHFAVRVDDNTFNAVVIGEVDVTGLLDDDGQALANNTFYFLSQTVAGKLATEEPTTGIKQVVIKTNTTNNATISIEIPFDDNSGGGGIAPNNVINPKIKVGNSKLTISWEDPGDTIVEGQLLATWAGTKLIQKAGSYPENVKDGTLILDNKVKDAYATNGFEISGLTNGQTYYFQLFPYSDKNAVNENVANRLSGTPQPYKVMTAIIDLSNSNPATCITYADDAVGMTAGSAVWDEFFGHYPVILKDGVEGVKLNPNDYTKDIDGNTVNLASTAVGDVMVAFPRRGVKITTVGNTLTVKMTDDPDNPEFEYLAHTRGTTRKEKFYLGAYKGFTDASKLRSWSGKAPTASQTIATFRTQARANGAGYDQSGFYQLTFRQAMYILKYRNLDSQTVIGRGFVDGNSAATNTGSTNQRGMDWGETTGKQQMKLFGLEDFWGNVREWIDGLVSTSTWNMLTATDNFNDTGAGYMDNGQGASANIGNYMSKPQGTTKTGFIAKEVTGSDSTYFCDYAVLNSSCVAYFGGSWRGASDAGAFCLLVSSAVSYSYANIGARLMFL